MSSEFTDFVPRSSARSALRVGPTTPLLVALVVVVVAAIALTTFLNVLRFQETHRNFVEQYLDVQAQELAGDLLVGVDLGLRLSAIENLDEIVTMAVNPNGTAAAAAVHDCDGKVLSVAPDAGVRGELESVIRDHAEPGAEHWHHFSRERIALGLRLENSFGECAGGVVLLNDGELFAQAGERVVSRLIAIGWLASLTVLPAMLLLSWYFRLRERLFRRLEEDLERVEAGQADAACPTLSSDGSPIRGETELLEAYRAARPVLLEGAGVDARLAPEREVGLSEARAERLGLQGRWQRWKENPVLRVLLATGLTLLLALAAVTWFASGVLRDTLLPELAQKGRAESVHAARSVQRALDLDIPLEGLVGVDAVFAAMRRHDADLAFLAVLDVDGRIVHSSGDAGTRALARVLETSAGDAGLVGELGAGQRLAAAHLISETTLWRVGAERERLGSVVVGHREAALLRPIRESAADLLIVLFVSLFVAFELVLLVVTIYLTQPLRATVAVLRDVAARRYAMLHGAVVGGALAEFARRIDAIVRRRAAAQGVEPQAVTDPRLIGVRLLGFLFVFAEELARPIMPVFYAQFVSADAVGGAHVGSGLIMALHMAVIAVSMPLGSMLYSHIGRRRMYVVGALLASAGLIGTGLADSFAQLLVCRVLSGIGYALTFVACQGFVIEATRADNRASGTAMMVGGIMLADICGPAVGGIIAAWVGYGATFVIGGCIAAFAAVSVTVLMGGAPAGGDVRPPRITLRAFSETLRNREYLVVLVFAAIPAKLLLGGLLMYMVPLALLEYGSNAAEVGRVLMLYGVMGLLLGPVLAPWVDRFGRPQLGLIMGGALTGLGAVPLAFFPSSAWVVVFVLAIGIGQAMSIPALFSASLAFSGRAVAHHGQGPVMAVLRLIERLGGALGPICAALLTAALGIQGAMGLLGVYALTCAAILWMRLGLRAPALEEAK